MNNRRTRKAILAKVKRAREVADFDRLFGIKKEELTFGAFTLPRN